MKIEETGRRNILAQLSKCQDLRHVRPAVRLNRGLEKVLCAYATAAAAAGVGLLALTNSAEGKIIYTPADINIPINNKQSVLLDLNHDGIADFSFWNVAYQFSEGEHRSSLDIGCAVSGTNDACRYQRNEIWGKGVSGRYASALRPGFTVHASRAYFKQTGKIRRSYMPGPVAMMAGFGGAAISGSPTSTTWGQWLYTKNRYLGLQFVIGKQVHYGWARVAVTLSQYKIVATLTGYAYETIPNKPIVTGKTKGPDVITLEPTSLGRLAQGASGVSAWRGKR